MVPEQRGGNGWSFGKCNLSVRWIPDETYIPSNWNAAPFVWLTGWEEAMLLLHTDDSCVHAVSEIWAKVVEKERMNLLWMDPAIYPGNDCCTWIPVYDMERGMKQQLPLKVQSGTTHLVAMTTGLGWIGRPAAFFIPLCTRHIHAGGIKCFPFHWTYSCRLIRRCRSHVWWPCLLDLDNELEHQPLSSSHSALDTSVQVGLNALLCIGLIHIGLLEDLNLDVFNMIIFNLQPGANSNPDEFYLLTTPLLVEMLIYKFVKSPPLSYHTDSADPSLTDWNTKSCHSNWLVALALECGGSPSLEHQVCTIDTLVGYQVLSLHILWYDCSLHL